MSNARILIVEDEVELLSLNENGLRAQGWSVTGVTRAADAIDELRRTRNFNLLVCDLNLPRMSGLDLIKDLRNLELGTLPVLVITGGLDRDVHGEVQKLGVQGILNKPFSMADLTKQIRKALS